MLEAMAVPSSNRSVAPRIKTATMNAGKNSFKLLCALSQRAPHESSALPSIGLRFEASHFQPKVCHLATLAGNQAKTKKSVSTASDWYSAVIFFTLLKW